MISSRYDIIGIFGNKTVKYYLSLTVNFILSSTSISVEDICNRAYGLTERQREIALLRLDYSYREIANILDIEQCTVFIIHTTSVNKIIKAKLKEQQGLAAELSQQQNEILTLMKQGFKSKEIALQLGITESTVKVQKNRIKKRLTKP